MDEFSLEYEGPNIQDYVIDNLLYAKFSDGWENNYHNWGYNNFQSSKNFPSQERFLKILKTNKNKLLPYEKFKADFRKRGDVIITATPEDKVLLAYFISKESIGSGLKSPVEINILLSLLLKYKDILRNDKENAQPIIENLNRKKRQIYRQYAEKRTKPANQNLWQYFKSKISGL